MRRRPRRNISSERKAAYYVGNIITLIGLALFLSTFVGVICIIADPPSISESGRVAAWTFGRAIVGFIMIIIGQVVANIGKRGLAGSGVILDPEQAREDVEPWSRMAGGMTNDVLSEVEPVQKIADGLSGHHKNEESEPIVKVRCRNCRTLNDEDAKFCDQCGQAM